MVEIIIQFLIMFNHLRRTTNTTLLRQSITYKPMRIGYNLTAPINLTSQVQRDFTKYIQEDTQSSAERLFFYQKLFEKDPKNLEAAHLYLRELNREGKYLTVVRLF
jgi:hypothetical protein